MLMRTLAQSNISNEKLLEVEKEYDLYIDGTSAIVQNVNHKIQKFKDTSQSLLIIGGAGTGKSRLSRNFLTYWKLRTQRVIVIDSFSHMAELNLIDHSSLLLIEGLETFSFDQQETILNAAFEHGEPKVGKLVATLTVSNEKEKRTSVKPELFKLFENSIVTIPPLKDRKKDILTIAGSYLKEKQLCDKAYKKLYSYSWPGNLRELKSFITLIEKKVNNDDIPYELFCDLFEKQKQNIVSLKKNNFSTLEHSVKQQVQGYIRALKGHPPTIGLYGAFLEALEKPLIEEVLHYTDDNQLKAAKILGINRNTLSKKIKNLNIKNNRDG